MNGVATFMGDEQVFEFAESIKRSLQSACFMMCRKRLPSVIFQSNATFDTEMGRQ